MLFTAVFELFYTAMFTEEWEKDEMRMVEKHTRSKRLFINGNKKRLFFMLENHDYESVGPFETMN